MVGGCGGLAFTSSCFVRQGTSSSQSVSACLSASSFSGGGTLRTSCRLPQRVQCGFGQRRFSGTATSGSRCLTMLFTGIVEEMGSVRALKNLESGDGGVEMKVECSSELIADTVLGESIAVNGTCLTVTAKGTGDQEANRSWFTVGIIPETLRCTNLGSLEVGVRVNLERSVQANGRLGGHMVQGHVDSTGTIRNITTEKDALWFTISVPREFMAYIVPKGYIAVDGTSLTVCDVCDQDPEADEHGTFTFSMIPFTQDHVIQAQKRVGDRVNLEVDIMGKYIERILAARGLV